MGKKYSAFERGYLTYEELAAQQTLTIDVVALERSISGGEVGRALYRIMDEFASDNTLDGKAIAMYQRAMAGWIIGSAQKREARAGGTPFPISSSPPEDAQVRRSLRLLTMVAELHKAGYQRIRIAPAKAASGDVWRCGVTSVDNVRENGWEPIEAGERIAYYASTQENRYFGWADAPGKSARFLAMMFLERFPEIARRGIGRDHAYVGWFVEVLGGAENGRLPIPACNENTLDWAKVPPPRPIRSVAIGDEEKFSSEGIVNGPVG